MRKADPDCGVGLEQGERGKGEREIVGEKGGSLCC